MPTAFLSPSIGLTNSDLEKTTASASDVLKDKTFYAGNNTIKTGTIPVMTRGYAKSISLWTNESGEKFIQGNTIPVGYYKSNGEEYSPQINIPASLFGNAARTDVLSGKSFTSSNGAALSGTMVNRGAWNGTVNPGKSITIPKGYHNGSGKVTASTVNPNMKLVNRTVSWGSGVIFSGDDTSASKACQFGLQYYANSEYNVHIEFRIYRNNSRIDTIYINREGGLMYDPRGYINKRYNGSGTYKYDVNVTYQAGNGSLMIGGMIVGY